jgi:hypothetical protein
MDANAIVVTSVAADLDGTEAPVLGTGHQLGDGEHPGSARKRCVAVLDRGLADQDQEGDFLGYETAATEATGRSRTSPPINDLEPR